MEYYISYSCICALFSRNLETYLHIESKVQLKRMDITLLIQVFIPHWLYLHFYIVIKKVESKDLHHGLKYKP